MKKFTLMLSLLIGATSLAQTPCSGGTASGFPCDNFNLQDQLTFSDLDTNFVSDSWGWTDPDTGNEYAIVGLFGGTAFVDITDPNNIVHLGTMPTHSGGSIWRDIKVYNNHAFVVSEADNHGMQVFDLTRLRDITTPPDNLDEDAHYDEFGDAHNIVINEESGFAYAVGTSTFNGGPHFIDISDPLNPTAAGGYSGDGYTHDAQVITYNGPDTEHVGKEILVGSNSGIDEVVIIDVTIKNAPVRLSTLNYSESQITHQGWFTDDQRYFIVGDEGDESISGFNTRTLVFDFSDLDDPELAFEHLGETPATDHNGYVVGDTYILANYAAGMRALDISDLENENIEEIGFFDTIPGSNAAGTSTGTWNVYPYFASGNIIMSGAAGLTVVKSETILATPDFTKGDFSLSPNPAKELLTIFSKDENLEKVEVFNVLGQLILTKDFGTSQSETINISSLNSGMYLVKINNNTTKRLVVN